MTTTSPVVLTTYIHALLAAVSPQSPLGQRLVDWLHLNGQLVGIECNKVLRLRGTNGRLQKAPAYGQPLTAKHWAKLKRAVAAQLRVAANDNDIASSNLAQVAAALRLDPVEAAVLTFTFLLGREQAFDKLCDRLVETKAVDSLGLLSVCLGHPVNEIWKSLSSGTLAKLRLIEVTGDGNAAFAFYMSYRLFAALLPPNQGLAAVEQTLIGQLQSARLVAEDYGHVAAARDFVTRLLRGALRDRSAGINILLHGAPGTGKTEFCRMIAGIIGCDLYAVGEVDSDGDELPRDGRLDALRLADRLAARRGNCLLLFDEMEDVLQAGDRTVTAGQAVRRAGSKVFFNRLLEGNAVPVLWTTNAIDEFDPAFLRRMTFIFEMKPMPLERRSILLQGAAAKRGFALNEAEARELARRHPLPPAAITTVMEAVAMADGNTADLDFVLAARPGAGRRKQAMKPASFALDLANADIDLIRLSEALARPAAPRDVTFCFYGPPGTGKSVFARELAQRMEMEPLVKKGSDLLSKWVGGTEENLAAAFEEARRDQAFLIIDEAESFLWQRGGARVSWEVSMVNELLVQMEEHKLPFACTTNHLEALDPAALRRFSFKVKFDFMTPSQLRRAFTQFLGTSAPEDLRALDCLTPGDFAVVAKKLRVLDLLAEVSITPGADRETQVMEMLLQERAAKNVPRRIGF